MPGDTHRIARHVETRSLFLFVLIAGPIVGFALIANQVMGDPIALDRQLMLAFRSAGDAAGPIGPLWFQEAVRDLTALGSNLVIGALAAGALGFLLISGKRAEAACVLAAVLGAMVLNTLIKMGFSRPRPDIVVPGTRVFTASFPSGHAAVSASTYLTLAALAARTTSFRGLRIYFHTLGVVLILLIGLSRIYLGVHYPTDILAGWCVGASWAAACWATMTWLQRDAPIDGSIRQ